MHQIVVQHFELESIPQPAPGAAEYSIHKLAPQLHKVVDLGHVLVYAVAHTLNRLHLQSKATKVHRCLMYK